MPQKPTISDINCGTPPAYVPNPSNTETYWAYLSNSVTVSSTFYGTRYSYTCKDGFVSYHNRTSTQIDLHCTVTGRWQPVEEDNFCVCKFSWIFDFIVAMVCPWQYLGGTWRTGPLVVLILMSTAPQSLTVFHIWYISYPVTHCNSKVTFDSLKTEDRFTNCCTCTDLFFHDIAKTTCSISHFEIAKLQACKGVIIVWCS